jgi:putative ABC transport system permease protein
MFDLEESIRLWKKNLQKQPTFEDGTVADFENHLRDAIEELRSEGVPEEKAFREAAARVGGAEKSQLMGQFLLESASVTLAAVVLSALAAGLLIKPAADLFGAESGSLLTDLPRTLFLLLGIGVISAALAGAYLAAYLSGFRPSDVFRRVDAEKPGRSLFRNGLVVVQFAISVFLIIGTAVVGKQVRFIRNKDLGFNREQILVVSVGQNKDLQARGDILKTELLKIPGIQGSTFSSTLPMQIDWRNGFDYEGRTDEARDVSACCCYVDPDYCDVFGLRVIIKDFNNLPLSLRIEPVALIQSERNRRLLSIKVRPDNMEKTISAVKTVWDEFTNGWPFEYRFMDEAYNEMYEAQMIMSRQARVFSAVALFLTCFGLFGLVSFMSGRRTKEIGIRKVLGASAPEICRLLSRGFTIPILLANGVAWPVSYLCLRNWLQRFAYHVDLGIGVFLEAAVLTWLIGMITVAGRSYKAAAANPVKSIRYE